MSQTMLFRPGKMLRVWDLYDVDYITVPASDVEPYLSRGWYTKPGEWEQAPDAAQADEQPKRRGRPPKVDAQ